MKNKKNLLIVLICFLSLFACGLFISTKYIPVVLMYHYVGGVLEARTDKRIVSSDTFRKQMRFLKNHGYKVVPLEKIASYFKRGERVPLKTLAITFDDGHRDNYEKAYPVLREYNLPATIFMIVDSIDKDGFVSSDMLKQMNDSGLITIGSHTLSHVHLPSVKDDSLLRKEIFDSKKKLENILGSPVTCISYPVGGFNAKIIQMVKGAGYHFAAATSPGLDYPNNDPFAIKRIRISENSSNLFIFWFETTGFYKYFLEQRKKNERK